MTPAQHATLDRIAARRWKIAAILSAAMLVAYFGFILLIAFAKPSVGALVIGGAKVAGAAPGPAVSVGILLGAAVIILTPVLTGIYVWWANRGYDDDLAKLRAEVRS